MKGYAPNRYMPGRFLVVDITGLTEISLFAEEARLVRWFRQSGLPGLEIVAVRGKGYTLERIR